VIALPPIAQDTRSLAKRVRRQALRMVHRANASHIGGCLSMADLLAVLYGKILRIDPKRPDWPQRDRFILSKGHGAAALYAVLAEVGFCDPRELERYCTDGSTLAGHVTRTALPGVEVSTGSLGHGLPIACGMALADRCDGNGRDRRVLVLLSDGECDEGTTWEAALFAAHHRLGNLTLLIDYNKIQSFGSVKDVLGLEPLADKWRSFGWRTLEIDGHDHDAILQALTPGPTPSASSGEPTVVIAHTVKGKGVPFMEHDLLWHYRAPNPGQLQQAFDALEAAP
jgi:transketolase